MREKIKNLFSRIYSWRITKFLIWLVYDFSGIRFIYGLINPPEEGSTPKKKPASKFIIWILGIYIALWGLATQIYESKNNKIQTRLSAAMIGLESNLENKNYGTLISCQMMQSPIEPEIFKPWTSFISLAGDIDLDYDVVDDVKNFIETKRYNLSEAYLSDAYLRGAYLRGADLSYANLSYADLSDAYLGYAYLSYVNLREVDLRGVDLSNTDLSYADLRGADLSDAYLRGANLSYADLSDAYLSDEQIKQVKAFYSVDFGDNKELLNRIKEIAPEKLK